MKAKIPLLRNLPILVLLMLSLLLANSATAKSPPTQMTFKEVAQGVYVYQGELEAVFDSQYAMVANISFIVGNKSVAVIDTGSSHRQGQLILAAIRKVSDLPIDYIINTHVHPDHIFGNSALANKHSKIIAHHLMLGDFKAKVPYYMTRFDGDWFEQNKPLPPNTLVKGSLTIDLGGRQLRLQAHNPAHTQHDLTVYDETTQTLITGDLLFEQHCPSLEGSVLGWLKLLDTLQAMPVKLMVPGHGAVQSDNQALVKLHSYLSYLVKKVRQALAEQADLAVLSENLMQDQAEQWALFDVYHKRNVIQAYTELEWE